MLENTVVTRGNQITLTKKIREKLQIREGDSIVLNLQGEILMISKKNPEVFDKTGDFLPENFDKTLKSLRNDSRERFKRLGIY